MCYSVCELVVVSGVLVRWWFFDAFFYEDFVCLLLVYRIVCLCLCCSVEMTSLLGVCFMGCGYLCVALMTFIYLRWREFVGWLIGTGGCWVL